MSNIDELKESVIDAVIAWRKNADARPLLIDASDALLAALNECACSATVREYCASWQCHGGSRLEDITPVWVERTWVDVRAGDIVRPLASTPGVDASAHAAIVLECGPVNHWHAAPGASQYRPNESPAEWSAIRVVMESIAEPKVTICPEHGVKPDAPVEIEVTESELRAIELLGGWENRVGVLDS